MTWRELKKPQRVQLIKDHWVPNCSAEALAQVVSTVVGSDVTRHAILGLYNRNREVLRPYPLGGAAEPSTHSHRNYERRIKVKAKPERQPAPALEPEGPYKPKLQPHQQDYDAGSRHIALHRVGPNQCHWPVNNPALGEQHLFCGSPTSNEALYCEHHRARAFK